MPEKRGQSPKITSTKTLVFPLDGFVNSYGMLEQMMKKLAENGLINTAGPREALPPTR